MSAATSAASNPIDRVLAELRARECNPRQSRPGQWNARCPVAHNHKRGDRNPSLSVGEGVDGKALLNCNRGCPMPEVAHALGLEVTDLFPERPPSVTHIGGGGRIKATYGYYDEDGTLLFEAVRYEPKDFRQRQPDGNGGWIWNLRGVDRKPLYQLPQVLAAVAERRPVWVVEGEKDAENLAWAVTPGVTTCNPMGAGKWRPEHTDALAGAAEVHIVADADSTGIDHARHVAEELAAVVEHVTVWLPAGDHKDASQHLGSGLGLDALRRVWATGEPLERIDAALDAVDTTDEPAVDIGADEQRRADLLGLLIDWPEFWKQDHAAEEWVARPLVPAGRQVALFAPAKTGKSILTLAIVAAVATGRPVLGAAAGPPRNVLYLDYEMTESDLYERLESLGYGPDVDMACFHYALLPSLPALNTGAGCEALCALAAEVDAEVVVIDTMGRAVAGEENDADTYRDFARLTGVALKAAGRAVLRTDHAGKDRDKGQRGSSAKNDDVDVVFRLDAIESGYTLTRTHSRVAWVPERSVIHRQEDDDGFVSFVIRGNERVYATGTRELAAELDRIGIPLDASFRGARTAAKEAGIAAASVRLKDALAWRRDVAEAWLEGLCVEPQASGNTPFDLGEHRNTLAEVSGGEHSTPETAKPQVTGLRNTSGNTAEHGEHLAERTGNTTAPYKGSGVPHAESGTSQPTGWLFADPDATCGHRAAAMDVAGWGYRDCGLPAGHNGAHHFGSMIHDDGAYRASTFPDEDGAA